MEESAIISKDNSQRLELLPEGVKSIDEMRKWSMFLAILGFIGVGLMLLASIFMGTIFGALEAFGNETLPRGLGVGISMMYLVIAIVYFFPVYYLLQFSIKAKRAVQEASNNEFTNAIKNLKSHYKFVGIMTIVVMVVYPILVFALLAGGVIAGL